ncbi:sulfate permease family domain-containing protein [Trichoderma breve]|uniref:Sulfate permease family domain-containing protein n=1 Tax=Trichoderma breve TaxID=2034170 RepID=A0A9W9E920_9HYPO|nr:sulfate permease family domain-containing protein [Trichoderma breve]KAJ4862295.1 sulfate permease family domain-containing protein [Trichoderma breve]
MERVSKGLSKAKEDVVTSYRTDANYNRVKRWAGPIARRIPSAAAEYLIEKVPIIQWLPRYDPKWLLNDFLAGITVGVMFVPQGISYAKIATIPVVHGLYSAWIPSLLYLFMGTSKEVSSGPTSVLGLLTAEAVSSLPDEDPATVASAVAFMVGVYALIVGALKLGFLLDFVSGPVLTGWISAVALVILLGQVGSLVGLTVGSTTVEIIRGVLGHLDKIQGMTACIGLTGIAMLLVFEHVGKTIGKKNKWVKFVCTSRAAVVLVIYTLISWGVNKNRAEPDYMWAVTEIKSNGLQKAKSHDTALLAKVAGRAVAPFIAMSIEHLGVGKAFGLRNGYDIDRSQELVFLGTANMVASIQGSMASGGAMSRTAVSSEAGSRSPLNFIFTSGFVLLTLYELAPALYWIPKATLAAIIIMAVAHLVSPPKLFYRYWRISFIDFVGSMLGFWVTLFTSTEIGLAVSVGFSLVYTLLRLAFPRLVKVSHSQTENNHWTLSKSRPNDSELDVPPEAYLVRFTSDLLFPNAERLKNSIVEDIKVRYAATTEMVEAAEKNRMWNDSTKRRITKIRHREQISPIETDHYPLRYIVLDFGMISFIDTTGVLLLIELKMTLRKYLGKDLQFRFVNMAPQVLERFTRSEWEFAREGEERTGNEDVIYSSFEVALLHRDGDEKDEKVEFVEKTLDV